jgi:hypothetical protein
VDARCARCDEPFVPELYIVVDADERPDLVQRIEQGSLHTAVCPHCHVMMTFGMPLLVLRPRERVRVIYSPVPGVEEQLAEEHANMLGGILRQRLGSRWDDSLGERVYIAARGELPDLVDLDLELLPEGRDLSLREALDHFMFSATWEESRETVEREEELLLSREAEFVLRSGVRRMEAKGEAEMAAMGGEHLRALQDCRSRGVAAAMADRCRLPGPTVKNNLVAVLSALGDSVGEDPQWTAALARTALGLMDQIDDEEQTVLLHSALGDALLDCARSGVSCVTDDAAWHYRRSLKFSTREKSESIWISLTLRLLEAVRLTPSFPTAPQLALSIICRAEQADRTLYTLAYVWPDAWYALKDESEPPELEEAVEELLAAGMVHRCGDGAAFEVPAWVAACVSDGLSPSAGAVIDQLLADRWLDVLTPPEDGAAVGAPGPEVASAILSVAPYLAPRSRS